MEESNTPQDENMSQDEAASEIELESAAVDDAAVTSEMADQDEQDAQDARAAARQLTDDTLRKIAEAAIMAAERPVTLDHILELLEESERPDKARLREIVQSLQEIYVGRGIELVEVASGFRFQVSVDVAPWISRMWEERPTKYSRAFLETLAIIAYRQPITRAEIEDIRGVSVSSNIMKTLQERGWVRVVGVRDVPGRPSMFGTTKDFLDYFNIKGLGELPALAELRDLDAVNEQLDLGDMDESPVSAEIVSFEDGVEVTSDDIVAEAWNEDEGEQRDTIVARDLKSVADALDLDMRVAPPTRVDDNADDAEGVAAESEDPGDEESVLRVIHPDVDTSSVDVDKGETP